MLESLHHWLEPKATWAMVVILFFLFIFSAQGFNWRKAKLGENETLDMQYTGYSPSTVAQIFGKYKKEQLKLYAYTELTLDIVFPLVYGFLLVFLTIHIFSAGKAEYLILLPIIGALADVCENISIAYLALSFDGRPSPIAWLAAGFTLTKIVLLVVGTLALLLGAVISFFKGAPV